MTTTTTTTNAAVFRYIFINRYFINVYTILNHHLYIFPLIMIIIIICFWFSFWHCFRFSRKHKHSAHLFLCPCMCVCGFHGCADPRRRMRSIVVWGCGCSAGFSEHLNFGGQFGFNLSVVACGRARLRRLQNHRPPARVSQSHPTDTVGDC